MKRILLGSLVVIAGIWSGAGLAADMPVKAAPIAPVWNWSGFYAGGHLGYGWAFPEITIDATGTALGNPPRPRGVLGGAQVGYNWQSGHWVYGLEADYTWSDIKGSSNGVTPFGILNVEGSPDAFATLTARLGYADGRFLYYVKGGAAWMNEKFSQISVTTPICVGTACTGSNSTTGWTASVGGEFAIDQRWSARLEYTFLDFPKSEAVTTTNGVTSNFFHLTRTFDLIKLGVNYKFGG